MLDRYKFLDIGKSSQTSGKKEWIGAAIGAGASLLGGVIGSFGASNQQKREQAFNREMWQKQVEQQDKVNQQQMAYQDKVNAENREWNTESNVRKRIEDAGYNPYLYNQNATGSAAGVSSATNFDNGVTAMPMQFQNTMQGMAQGVSGLGAAAGSMVDTLQKNYNFKRQQKANKIEDGYYGGQEGAGAAQMTISEIEENSASARNAAASAAAQEITNAALGMTALDENGAPMVDENGNKMTIEQANKRGQMLQTWKQLDKLAQDLQKGKLEVENLSFDKLIKEYKLEEMMPEELAILRQSYNKLVAEIRNINEDTKVKIATVGKIKQDSKTSAEQANMFRKDAELKDIQYLYTDASRANTIEERKNIMQRAKNLMYEGEYLKWNALMQAHNYDIRWWNFMLHVISVTQGISANFTNGMSKLLP